MSLSTLFSNAINCNNLNSNNSNQQRILFTPPIDIIINHVFGKELYPWQKEMIHKWFKNNTDTEIVFTSRQCGLTSLSALFAVINASITPNVGIVFFTSKHGYAYHLMDVCKKFCKSGSISYKSDQTSIQFENGSTICMMQNHDPLLGKRLDQIIVFVEEYDTFEERHTTELQKTIKVLMSQTNHLKTIFGGNPYGTNLKTTADVLNISPTRIQFWDVPGRDLEWLKKQVSYLGNSYITEFIV